MSIRKHTIDNTDVVIYAETDNINYFLKTNLEADEDGGATNVQQEVKAHKRRQYVGDDTPSDVPKTTRTVLVDPGRRNGTATPGKEFILDDGTERRAFTFTGPFVDLHSFITGDAKMDLFLYSPSARYSIKEAGGEGVKVQ